MIFLSVKEINSDLSSIQLFSSCGDVATWPFDGLGSGKAMYLVPFPLIKSPEDFVIPKDLWQSCKAVVIDEVLEARAVWEDFLSTIFFWAFEVWNSVMMDEHWMNRIPKVSCSPAGGRIGRGAGQSEHRGSEDSVSNWDDGDKMGGEWV